MQKLLLLAIYLALVQAAGTFPNPDGKHAAGYPRDIVTHSDGRSIGSTLGFDPVTQLVDVTGPHRFLPPGSADQRGPCPGLNALANHGYIPRNGIATADQLIQAMISVYGLGLDVATALAIPGVALAGDGMSMSLGGPVLLPGLLGLLSRPNGLIGSHNRFETDVSPTRGDLYEYGNDYHLRLDRFQQLYNRQDGVPDDEVNFGMDVLTAQHTANLQHSIDNNPYLFKGILTGEAIEPGTYSLIARIFANHSVEHPEGRLDRATLKSFLGVSGEDGTLKYTPGNERIPSNWYRRAIGDEYTILTLSADIVYQALKDPRFLNIGGNLAKVNTFTGVDISNLTGGVYNAHNLLQGNNVICFAFQAASAVMPDILSSLFSDITGLLAKVDAALGNALQGLGCPVLAEFNDAQLRQFPGYTRSL